MLNWLTGLLADWLCSRLAMWLTKGIVDLLRDFYSFFAMAEQHKVCFRFKESRIWQYNCWKTFQHTMATKQFLVKGRFDSFPLKKLAHFITNIFVSNPWGKSLDYFPFNPGESNQIKVILNLTKLDGEQKHSKQFINRSETRF